MDELGLAGGSMVKNPPARAGDTGSIADQGRSHVLQSDEARAHHSCCGRALEPGTAPTEPTGLESVAQHEEPLQEEAPLAASREKPIAAAKTQHGPK